MLSVQQSPNDKSGLGFNSNNKNKSKSKSKSNKKKGQDKVKDPAKLVCFKCKVEGHHVRSCPLKKKKHLSEKQQGKRPQGQGQAHARPQVEDRPLPKKNQDIVPQEKKSIKKRKGNTCYLCRVKGHFASSCLSGTLSNPIIVDNDYSLGSWSDLPMRRLVPLCRPVSRPTDRQARRAVRSTGRQPAPTGRQPEELPDAQSDPGRGPAADRFGPAGPVCGPRALDRTARLKPG
ncbi:hypothetical protein QYE76_001064 [Lolium multiflorum]|uniref:CCHC-type domain-containing protein n=1 Tax=Lolium multiflorum TaxID=4521 RepID=A0AAD8VY84_LOLMU|nr:hypothetical protein QYE76_001064 [Lolium multiflorum]